MICVVTPALNEEGFLPGLIDSLVREFASAALEFEIVIADNGSTDRTREIAIERGCRVVDCSGLTIGGARNRGVESTAAELIVFLDADMMVEVGWGRVVADVKKALARTPDRILGGSVASPLEAGAVARVWFPTEGAVSEERNYVGTGHMILRRDRFAELGGFDESLATAEDYDLCLRNREAGGTIHMNSELVARHRGVPYTFGEFYRRESWHGGATTIGGLLRQRVSLVAAAWLGSLVLFVGFVARALVASDGSVLASLALLGFLVVLATMKAGRRFRSNPIAQWPLLIGLGATYLTARGLGLVRALGRRPTRRHDRAERS